MNDADEDDDLKYFEDDEDVRDYTTSKKAAKSDLKSQWNTMLAENDPVAMDPYHKISSEGINRNTVESGPLQFTAMISLRTFHEEDNDSKS